MAYLKSIFPGQFVPAAARPAAAPLKAGAPRFAGWAYGHERAFALERAVLFHTWQAAAHESELARAGDFVTADLGVERVLLIRDAYGTLQALRNSCPEVPHALVTARRGRIEHTIDCPVHGLKFDRSGRSAGGAHVGLEPLDLHTSAGFLLVRSAVGALRGAPLWPDGAARAPLRALAAAPDLDVEADWKLLVELWLAGADADAQSAAQGLLSWSSPAGAPGWSAAHYRRLAGSTAAELWRYRFIAPNQLLQARPDGVTLLQAIAVAPGRCRVRRIHLTYLTSEREAAAAQFLAARLMSLERRSALAIAESAQRGVIDFGYRPAAESPVRAGVAWFRELLASQLPALSLERPPTESS